MTTFFACCALYCCAFLWFRLFGCFITMLIFSSYFASMFGMTALLAEVGPDEGQADVHLEKYLRWGVPRAHPAPTDESD
jgi:hypothetical protein